MNGKHINELAIRNPDQTDLLVFWDAATGETAQTTIDAAIQAGLPHGMIHADILAYSTTTQRWAPLPTEIVVQHGLPKGNHTGDLLFWNSSHQAWAPSPAAPRALNLIGGSGGSIPYQNNPESTHFLPIGTAGQTLIVGAGGSPKWQTISDLNYNIATLATNADVDDSSFVCGSFSNWDENEYIEIPINCANVKLDGLLTAKTINIQNNMGGAPNLQTFSATSLVSVAGPVVLNGISNLTQLNIPNLLECGGLYITGCNLLTQFRSPCHTYNGDIQVSQNAELTNFQISPALSARGIQVAGNPKLKFFQLPFDLKLYGQEISLQDNALVTTNGILHTVAQWDGKYGRHFWGGPGTWLNISGGTNVDPSSDGGFDGIAAAKTLIARGCTVTVNGAPITTTKKTAFAIPDFDTVADKGKTLKVKADGTGLEWVA